ncbi:uncharacterized protein LOC129219836 [Uloborus diversus]|uniref:uncharacterized protein LOC129219836 n=1 Tax=Uloborus diversus TaxID=327109 RepID=UPI002409D182|nr:uncharacterized protein LOC129219836 [Uloborus diversus]
MTVSEQMQGIIEDLTQSNRSGDTGSVTFEKEDEDQFNSDLEDMKDIDELLEDELLAQNILGMTSKVKTASEDTLVPSPEQGAVSEGAAAPEPLSNQTKQKWSSNPNNVSKGKRDRQEEKERQVGWGCQESFAPGATSSSDGPVSDRRNRERMHCKGIKIGTVFS